MAWLQASPSKKMWHSQTGITLWTTQLHKQQLVGNITEISGKWVISLKGFLNCLPHDLIM